MGAAAGQFAGHPPVAAGHIENAQAGHRAQQVKQGQRHWIIGGMEALNVEVGGNVIPGMSHKPTLGMPPSRPAPVPRLAQ